MTEATKAGKEGVFAGISLFRSLMGMGEQFIQKLMANAVSQEEQDQLKSKLASFLGSASDSIDRNITDYRVSHEVSHALKDNATPSSPKPGKSG